MKESYKFLIVIIVIAAFSFVTVASMGATISEFTKQVTPGSPNALMVNETFNNTTITVPATANFTNESGAFVDSRNQIIIQITDQGIPEAQFDTYANLFAEQGNLTQINSSALKNNSAAFEGPDNETMILVGGDNKTAVVMAKNKELAIKMANSVNFG